MAGQAERTQARAPRERSRKALEPGGLLAGIRPGEYVPWPCIAGCFTIVYATDEAPELSGFG